METGSEVGRGDLAQFYSGDASHETRLTLEAHQTASIRSCHLTKMFSETRMCT